LITSKRSSAVDEDVGFLVDHVIYHPEKIVIDLLFPEVHPACWVEVVERG
jgi:hypothetical protein